MQLKWRQVLQITKKLHVDLRDGKHLIGWVEFQGKKIIPVKLSYGEGDVPGLVADKIRQQYKLNETDFGKLRDCPLEYDGYISILKGKNLIQIQSDTINPS